MCSGVKGRLGGREGAIKKLGKPLHSWRQPGQWWRANVPRRVRAASERVIDERNA
jgi:hypothetical protein